MLEKEIKIIKEYIQSIDFIVNKDGNQLTNIDGYYTWIDKNGCLGKKRAKGSDFAKLMQNGILEHCPTKGISIRVFAICIATGQGTEADWVNPSGEYLFQTSLVINMTGELDSYENDFVSL